MRRGDRPALLDYNPRMREPQYAVVAYVKNAVGAFVEELRQELYPEHAYLPAHLTMLPPRQLLGGEGEAVEALQRLCREVEPFEVVIGQAASFAPVTPTVFLQIEHGAYRMRELHDRLNTALFQQDEPWPYMPHLTIVKMADLPQAAAAFAATEQRWAAYEGSRRILVDRLTFVREGAANRWLDLAPVRLGRAVSSPK